MVASEDRFVGCLLSLALGDAAGAPFEGGPVERLLWRLIGRTRAGERRWTDDTQMSLDVAESLIANGTVQPDDLAERFARSYRWSRGYGPSAAKILKRISRGVPWNDANRSVHPEGSFGNGGAMRAPVVGLFYASTPDLVDAVHASARVTHAHPLALEGAALVGAAVAKATTTRDAEAILDTAALCERKEFTGRLEVTREWITQGAAPGPKEAARRLGRGIAAAESCVTALYTGLRFLEEPFPALLGFVADMGGDVDTIGAMAGAVWGACNGAARLPGNALCSLEQRVRLEETARALHHACLARRS